MTIPNETKIPMLKAFHTHLYEDGWSYMYSQENDKIVLEKFYVVSLKYGLSAINSYHFCHSAQKASSGFF